MMASASSAQYHLAFLLINYYMLGLCIHVTCASSFAFNFSTTATSPCGKHLHCQGDVSFANQMIELTTRNNNMSRNCNQSQGRVWYASPVQLWDAGSAELASFTTTFSFKITPDKSCNNSVGTDNTGDGIAFFLTPYSTADVLNSSGGGGYLGHFNDGGDKYNATGGGSPVVAVEFDTYRNRWDNSGQHVGIHVNSIRSSASTNMSLVGNKVINLASNVTMTATINYDNRTKILSVNLDIDGASYHVNHTVDLKSFLPEKVAVGFSTATASSAELHRVSFWSFDSSLEEKVVPKPSSKIPYPSKSISPVKSELSTKYSSGATGSSADLQQISISSLDYSVEERAVPTASAPSEKILYPSIAIPPVKAEPSTKYSAVISSYADLHRVLLRSFDSSLEKKAVPPASAPSQKIPYSSIAISPVKSEPSTKYSTALEQSPDQHRIFLRSFDSSLEQKAVPPAPAPYQKILYPSIAIPPIRSLVKPEPTTKSSAITTLSEELHRVLLQSFDYSSSAQPPVPAPSQETPYPNVYIPPVEPERPTEPLVKILVPTLVVPVCAIAGLLWLWQKRRRNRKPNTSGNNSSDEQHEEADFEREVAGPRRFHYRELAIATGNFKDENRLGTGGFGSVYQGTLQGNTQVAVKKFSAETSTQGRKEFESEVKIIGRLRHRNLVQLLGWCDSAKGLLLVYELVPGGSLDKHIHNNPRLLTWSERYKIIMGLGSALRYLHREWDQCVVHGDIKPSNIMLDSSYNTKLGDFGLARLADHGADPRTTRNIAGTAGYVDPDFVNTRRPSTESDIYSFGIVLLEIVTAELPVVQDPPFVLLKWVWSLHSQGRTIDAADERLRGDAADERQMERALVVGLWCAHHDPAQRPSIVDAMLVLQSEDAKLPVLPLQMYKMAARPGVASTTTGESGVSGSSFSSGVRSAATTGTTRSSDSFPN